MDPYKITPHTSEVGLEAVGSDLPELFGNAAGGLLHLWAIDKNTEGSAQFKVELDGTDEGDLFVVWLNELVYLVQTNKVRPAKIAVTAVTAKTLSAVVTGAFAAKERDLAIEIKAATRAGELVKKTKTGWTAKVILDV